jgi:DNA-directed RNA polymerase specialized sigma24 family protein
MNTRDKPPSVVDGPSTAAADAPTAVDATPTAADGIPAAPAAPSVAPHVAWAATAEASAAVRARLRARRVPEQDVDDLVADVLHAFIAMARPPSAPDRCLAAARHLANVRAARVIRSRIRSARVFDSFVDDVDQRAAPGDAMPLAPPHVVRETKLQAIDDALTDGTVDPRTARMFALRASGLTDAEVAGLLGLRPRSVSNALARGRAEIRALWERRVA